MDKKKIFTKISGSVSKIAFSLKKKSPEIFMVCGIVGTVASTVLACRATLKAKPVIDDLKEQMNTIHECANDPEMAEKYSEEDVKKDTTLVYAHTAIKIAKLYFPAIALGALSIGSFCTSHQILHKRNTALAAAYAAVDKGFKAYRSRVIERFGEEVDRQLKYNIKQVNAEKEFKDPETGKTKKRKIIVEEIDPNDPNTYSPYAKFFDESNPNWDKDPEINLTFLRKNQNYFNDQLRINGHVFLNEVYDALGIPKTKAGQIVGWRYNPDNKDIDSYIDFGIYDIRRPAARDFVNGYERSILLDFNVDGNIWDDWDERYE